MTGRVLEGLRVIELSAFVAAPLCGATLAAMGAEVIRVDPPAGGLDSDRWPLWNGASLYWAGLNQGKQSVTINTRSERGRELVRELLLQGGKEGGILLTNLPVTGWLDYERMCERRPDLIMLAITGHPDGATAVDYTVNAAMGFPWITGPEDSTDPVNHVLPAWDALTGYLSVAALLAADRQRQIHGRGQLVRINLFDVALAVTSHLGIIAQAQLDPAPRPRLGNHLYGSFSHDFRTRDDRHVIVCALTPRQWKALLRATNSESDATVLEVESGEDLQQEGARYRQRSAIVAMLQPWFAERDAAEVEKALTSSGVLWAPYQTFQELVRSDPRASLINPIMSEVIQPGVGRWLAPGLPVHFGSHPDAPPAPAPLLGEHTDQVLHRLLGMEDDAIQSLRRKGVVGPRPEA